LGVTDAAVRRVEHGLRLEAEHAHEPVDRLVPVAIAQRGKDIRGHRQFLQPGV
jgi:hypothetical protein